MSDASPNIPPPPQPLPAEKQPEPDKTVPEPTGEGVVTEPYNQANEH
jgi:hypothetical protein